MFFKSQGTSFVHILHLFKSYHVLTLISPLKYIFQEVKAGLFKTGLMLALAYRLLRGYVICCLFFFFFLCGSLLLFYLKKLINHKPFIE